MRIERVGVAGNADPGGPPVHETNAWLIGDDTEVVAVDPALDVDAIERAVGGRRVREILLTHGHWDHVRGVPELARRLGTRVRLHPADRFLWEEENTGHSFIELADREVVEVAGGRIEARHTPGHTPGAMSFVVPDLGCVCSGDTLFEGGPGATRWQYSDFDQIIASITEDLLTLPDETAVHTGHGPSTTIGWERPALPEWIARRW